ncbi:hypothetical protein JCM1841_002410 [Sporobolomyces salmonicolor]
MSSFRRRTTVAPIPGSRPSPYTSLPLLSTGLITLDDLLGGGLPLSSSLVIDADSPTSYSELLLRYWIAQGLECRQDVLVVASGLDGGPQGVVETLMEVDGGPTARDDAEDEEERKREVEMQEKMKIAFRYEGMRQHQTTVEAPKGETDTYCSMFDLTTTRHLSSADRARLHFVDVDELRGGVASPTEFYDCLFATIESFVTRNGFLHSTDPSAPRKALRIAISSFGSPSWGPSTPAALYFFLHRLRHLLRRSHASTILTFPSHLYASPFPSSSGASPLLTRLAHAADALLRLTSFASSPPLAAQFPRHAGLLSLPKLPSLGTLTAPSAKLSVLRGLGGGGEGRENLLGFRVKRRRFVVEVVSDGPVGGGGEGGPEEEERKRNEARRRKVDEANRKEREMTGRGRERTDVLLGATGATAKARDGEVEVETPLRRVRISSEAAEGRSGEQARPPPALAKEKGVRIGGVRFAQKGEGGRGAEGGGEAAGQGTRQGKVSIARMLHQQPELLDF